MSSPEDEQPAPSSDAQSVRLRRLGRAAAVAIGLWLIADGLRGMWSGAGTVAQVLIVVSGVLAVAFVVVGLLFLARRGRGD
jgi:hypothetical protein